ncbi:LmeA family phospholipid-binding protein [Nocardioides pelophilus]|uniref:LmeA family phospholipid-binding protein n=1 Tax=Nocardioides pelophilus TaxID=2172019 RepID=UPI001602A5F9|nr:DUF2993 domain-containing protein [Nocardioides pelophilus]
MVLLNRRRVVAGSIALLLVLLLLADWLIGRHVADRVAGAVECRLGAAHADVEVGGWPHALSLVTRRIPSVRVRAEEVELSGVAADVDLRLADVRRDDGDLVADEATAVVSLPVTDLVERLGSGGRQVDVRGDGGRLVATVGPQIFAVSVLFQVELRSGRLVLAPDGVELGGRTLTGTVAERLVDRLLARQGDSVLATALGEGLPLPVPPSVELTDVDVVDQNIRLSARLDPADPTGLARQPNRC